MIIGATTVAVVSAKESSVGYNKVFSIIVEIEYDSDSDYPRLESQQGKEGKEFVEFTVSFNPDVSRRVFVLPVQLHQNGISGCETVLAMRVEGEYRYNDKVITLHGDHREEYKKIFRLGLDPVQYARDRQKISEDIMLWAWIARKGMDTLERVYLDPKPDIFKGVTEKEARQMLGIYDDKKEIGKEKEKRTGSGNAICIGDSKAIETYLKFVH